MMISAHCQLCSGQEAKVIQSTGVCIEETGIDLVKCRRCGLVFLWPRLGAEGVKSLYSEDYFLKWYGSDEKREAEKRYFRQLLAKAGLHASPGCAALDIGCGMGAFLEIGRENRWNVKGVEISSFASGYCRDKLGADVHTGTLETAGYPENSFEIITAFDVLEHIGDLTPFLNHIRRILKIGGRFVVLVPNYQGLVFQLDRIIRKWKRAPLPNTPEHLTYFTRQSLKHLLGVHGLRLRSVATTDANDQGDQFYMNENILARARALLNRVCRQAGKLSNRGEAVVAIFDKVA